MNALFASALIVLSPNALGLDDGDLKQQVIRGDAEVSEFSLYSLLNLKHHATALFTNSDGRMTMASWEKLKPVWERSKALQDRKGQVIRAIATGFATEYDERSRMNLANSILESEGYGKSMRASSDIDRKAATRIALIIKFPMELLREKRTKGKLHKIKDWVPVVDLYLQCHNTFGDCIDIYLVADPKLDGDSLAVQVVGKRLNGQPPLVAAAIQNALFDLVKLHYSRDAHAELKREKALLSIWNQLALLVKGGAHWGVGQQAK